MRAEVLYEDFETAAADLVVVAYGSIGRIAKTAVRALRAEGLKVGLLRPITLYPFPEEALRALRGYAAAGENAALRDYAAEAIPAVERHLEQAKRLPGAMPPVKVPPRPLANRRNSG